MSQNSLTLPTTGTVSGLQMTQDINNAIDTLNTLSSGAAAPGSLEAGQLWHDTSNNVLKLRSLDNTTWIPLFYLNETAYLAGSPMLGQIGGGSNRILNGAMSIDQMNEGASYSISGGGTAAYTLDQWCISCTSSASGITAQRVSDAPAGFSNSLKVTVATGASIGTLDNLILYQPIEGNNVRDMNFGSASAVPVSLSFWVKSSVTGDFAVWLGVASGSSRQLVYKFTIASAGTWQQVTVNNLPGDQGGTWPAGAAASLNMGITLAASAAYQTSTYGSWAGSNYLAPVTQANGVLTTSGSTFQLTGVMLNAGAFCYPFERRSTMNELSGLQRYLEKTYDIGTAVATATQVGSFINFPASAAGAINLTYKVTKRVDPSVTVYSTLSGTSGKVADNTTSSDVSATVSNIGQNNAQVYWTSSAGQDYTIQALFNARM